MRYLTAIVWALIGPSLVAAQGQLVWADEFATDGLPDAQKWGYDVGGGGWGNNELQYYTSQRSANARVENGLLIIEAIRENFENRQYTSARLVTRQKGDWKYGRVEVRAKLPTGRGTWPAIWMLPTDWVYGGWPASGEIDIMEHVGYDQGTVHGTVHTQAYNHTRGTQKGAQIRSATVSTDFHVYAVDWDENSIVVSMDGTAYFTFQNEKSGSDTWPFDQRFHLLLNIAVGGNWGGAQGVDTSIWPQRMEVDYVRVYAPTEEPATVHFAPGTMEAEAFSNALGVQAEVTGDTGGGLNLGWLRSGDWMEYPLRVLAGGSYTLACRYASQQGTAGVQCFLDGQALSEPVNLPATGGWQNWVTRETGPYFLSPGDHLLRLQVTDARVDDLNLNWLEWRAVGATWAGYPTGDFSTVDFPPPLGPCYVGFAPWAYFFQHQWWMYIPEEAVSPGGMWAYVVKPE